MAAADVGEVSDELQALDPLHLFEPELRLVELGFKQVKWIKGLEFVHVFSYFAFSTAGTTRITSFSGTGNPSDRTTAGDVEVPLVAGQDSNPRPLGYEPNGLFRTSARAQPSPGPF